MVLLGIDPPRTLTPWWWSTRPAGRWARPPWPPAPGRRTGCAGTCTSWIPTWYAPPAGCPVRACAAWPPGSRRPPERPGRHLPQPGHHDRLAHRPDRPTGPSTPPAGRPAGPSLLSLPGCGPLTAAKLIAETAGVAPVPASSGRTDRHRLSRGGNRQLNAALRRIAITQLGLPGPGQTYYRRRRAQGDGTVRPSPPSSAASPAPSTSDSELPNPEPTPSTPPLDRGATYSEERSCRGILRKRRRACARVRGSCGATPFVSAPVMLHPAGSQPTRAGEENRSRPKTLTSRSFSRPSTALEGPQSTTARRRSQ